MLPVIIYEAEERERGQMLSFLKQFSQDRGARLSVRGSAASKEEAAACVESDKGVFLLILGTRAGAAADAVALERRAALVNRDSYTLYWLHSLSDLPEVAAGCLRPAGFVLPPPELERFSAVMQRIWDDYAALTEANEDDFLSLQAGGTLHRLQIGAIDYIEALDKKLNIWTSRQCLTVYEKLGHMEELLGERFFRCHRSYLVNYARIERVDFAAMELQLAGRRLPLSRSAKDALKQRMRGEGAQP